MTRSSSRIAAARSSTCVRTSSSRSRCSSSSCLASGLTAPSSPRRRSSRSTRAESAGQLLGRQRLDGVDGRQAVLLGELGRARAQLGQALLGVRRLALQRAGARGGVALGAGVLGLVARALAQRAS